MSLEGYGSDTEVAAYMREQEREAAARKKLVEDIILLDTLPTEERHKKIRLLVHSAQF